MHCRSSVFPDKLTSQLAEDIGRKSSIALLCLIYPVPGKKSVYQVKIPRRSEPSPQGERTPRDSYLGTRITSRYYAFL
jgi:hypothetical protein